MGSAVGDYVHLTYAGYVEKRGAKKTPYFATYGAVMTRRTTQLKQWIEKQDSPIRKQLEAETQNIVRMLAESKNKAETMAMSQLTNPITEGVLSDIFEALKEENLFKRIDKYAALEGGLLEATGFQMGKAAYIQNADVRGKTISLINQALAQIQMDTENILSGQKKSLNSINKQIQNIKIKQEQLITQLEGFNYLNAGKNKQTAKAVNQLFKNLRAAINRTGVKDLKDTINLTEMLKNIVEGIEMSNATSIYVGSIAEAVTKVAADRLQRVGKYYIGKTLIEGAERAPRGLVTTNFSSEFTNLQDLLKTKTEKNQFGEHFIMSSTSSQTKVDVNIEVLEGEDAKLSVKNYSEKTVNDFGFGFASGDFLSLIQNENKNNLINHFLNLNSIPSHHTLDTSREAINDYVRQLTITKLITGYRTVVGEKNLSMDSANIFVFFNSTNYTVKFYSMSDLLNSVLFVNSRYKELKIPPQDLFISAQEGKTRYSDSAQRITDILRKLRVTVSYHMSKGELPK